MTTHTRCPECPTIAEVVDAALHEQPEPICPADTDAVLAAKVADARREAVEHQVRVEEVLHKMANPPADPEPTVGLADAGEVLARAFAAGFNDPNTPDAA